MNKETAIAINNVSKKVNEVNARLDRYFNNRANTNADGIEINAVGIDGLAEFSDTNAEGLDDLATMFESMCEMLDSLDERVTALEEKN